MSALSPLQTESVVPLTLRRWLLWKMLGLEPPATSTEILLAQFPRWWSVWARATPMSTFINGMIATFMLLHHPGALGRAVAVAILGTHVLLTVGYLPASWWLGRPIERVRAALRAGVDGEQLPRDDVLFALLLSRRLFWTVWVLHLAFGVSFALVAYFVPVLRPGAIDVVPGSLALGLVNAATQSSVIQTMVRRRVAPLLLPRGRLDHLVDAHGALPRTYVWQLLWLLAGSMGIAWPVLLCSMFHLPGEPGVAKLVVVGVLFVTLTTILVAGMMAGIAGSSGHLASRMDEVTAGDLSAQARVYGLDTFGVLSSDFNRMVEGLRQREELKENFGRYVTQQVLDEILAGRVALGGELKTATVLFSDIRGFTRMSEQLSPQEVVAFLNEYLEAMVDCVIEHGGVLDKFIGDAVMAVFGAPVSQGGVADDAKAAVACALAMQERLVDINERRAERGQAEIKIGIGVHTGPLVAGNIGSPKRMQYTVIGDTVNVGSRLESLTKEHQRTVLVSQATAELVRDRVALVEVGEVPVRGRAELLVIYGLQIDGPAAAVAASSTSAGSVGRFGSLLGDAEGGSLVVP